VPLAFKLAQLVDDFAPIEDAHERLAFAVDRSRSQPPRPAIHTDDKRVLGCISTVWLAAELRDGLIYFQADADSPLVRGLALLLTEFFSETTPAEVSASDADPLAALSLTANLSPTRQNGLAAVRAQIRALAKQHLEVKKSPP
jgi:cysteine desulfuration protein SufE